MAFKPAKKQPQFADLIGILAQSKDTDNPTYQLIKVLLERLTQLQLIVNDNVAGKLSDADAIKKFATKFATYHTKEDETAILPNSVQLLAGLGVTFDDTVPNKRTISVATSSGYWTPLTDGDLDEADLIFAAGECIAVFVPL